MVIFYRDESGIVACQLSDDGIDFSDGTAVFDCNDKTYKIPVENIVAIRD